MLEPLHGSDNLEQRYEKDYQTYAPEIEMAKAAIRQYGKQIEPKTLENMRCEFYEIMNSSKFRKSRIHSSVARSMLQSNWDGIGAWKF